MLKKPSKGFAWQCMTCLKKHPQMVDFITGEPIETPEEEAPEEGKGAEGEEEEEEEDLEQKYLEEIRDFGLATFCPAAHFPKSTQAEPFPSPSFIVVSDKLAHLGQIWPFRYLGLYAREGLSFTLSSGFASRPKLDTALSCFSDEFDDDLIFPYLQSRVGGNFQVSNLPTSPGDGVLSFTLFSFFLSFFFGLCQHLKLPRFFLWLEDLRKKPLKKTKVNKDHEEKLLWSMPASLSSEQGLLSFFLHFLFAPLTTNFFFKLF